MNIKRENTQLDQLKLPTSLMQQIEKEVQGTIKNDLFKGDNL